MRESSFLNIIPESNNQPSLPQKVDIMNVLLKGDVAKTCNSGKVPDTIYTNKT